MSTPVDVESILGAETPESDDDVKFLGTLATSPYWPPLKRMLLRAQGRAIERMASIETAPAVIAASQGKLQVLRELLDLLEKDAPARYLRRLEREGPPNRDS